MSYIKDILGQERIGVQIIEGATEYARAEHAKAQKAADLRIKETEHRLNEAQRDALTAQKQELATLYQKTLAREERHIDTLRAHAQAKMRVAVSLIVSHI